MAIACACYRLPVCRDIIDLPSGGAKLTIGKPAEQLTDYFEFCRRKRNEIDYTGATIATTTEKGTSPTMEKISSLSFSRCHSQPT